MTFIALYPQVEATLLAERYPVLRSTGSPRTSSAHVTLLYMPEDIDPWGAASILSDALGPGQIGPGMEAPLVLEATGFAVWRSPMRWVAGLTIQSAHNPWLLYRLRSSVQEVLKGAGIGADYESYAGQPFHPHMTVEFSSEQPCAVPEIPVPLLKMSAAMLWVVRGAQWAAVAASTDSSS